MTVKKNENELYDYFCNCVGWDPKDVHNEGGLISLIDSRTSITRKTFVRHTDAKALSDMEFGIGYNTHHTVGLTMSQDWHVEYFKSKLHGVLVYGFRHSGIEYVYTKA
ncbi:hypothetical protein GD1_208 [Paraglaciecola Antarctic GD virus 1]|nr:hypothetical protein GD1_208 [Paraglaciecola Antarctic GD virus 1]